MSATYSQLKRKYSSEDITTPDYVDPGDLSKISNWIHALLNISNDNDTDLFDELQSGVLLCELLNKIQPNTVPKFKRSTKAFFQRENIQKFIQGSITIGVNKIDTFDTNDLFEQKRLSAVIKHLIALNELGKKIEIFDGPSIEDIDKIETQKREQDQKEDDKHSALISFKNTPIVHMQDYSVQFDHISTEFDMNIIDDHMHDDVNSSQSLSELTDDEQSTNNDNAAHIKHCNTNEHNNIQKTETMNDKRETITKPIAVSIKLCKEKSLKDDTEYDEIMTTVNVCGHVSSETEAIQNNEKPDDAENEANLITQDNDESRSEKTESENQKEEMVINKTEEKQAQHETMNDERATNDDVSGTLTLNGCNELKQDEDICEQNIISEHVSPETTIIENKVPKTESVVLKHVNPKEEQKQVQHESDDDETVNEEQTLDGFNELNITNDTGGDICEHIISEAIPLRKASNPQRRDDKRTNVEMKTVVKSIDYDTKTLIILGGIAVFGIATFVAIKSRLVFR